jgi:hypothetical protein
MPEQPPGIDWDALGKNLAACVDQINARERERERGQTLAWLMKFGVENLEPPPKKEQN